MKNHTFTFSSCVGFYGGANKTPKLRTLNRATVSPEKCIGASELKLIFYLTA